MTRTLPLWLPALLCLAPALAELPGPEAPQLEESWYGVEIDGQPAGWMVERESREGGRLTTESILHLRLRRGGSRQELEMASGFVETEDGRPLRAWSRQTLGPTPVETSYEFRDGAIVVRTAQGGEVSERRTTLPRSGWLTPGRVQAEIRGALARAARSFRLRTIDPQLGAQPIDLDWTLEARDVEVKAGGRTFLASRWRQSASLAPQLPSLVYLAADGRLVRSSTPIMGMTVTATLSSREEALAASGAPELLVRSFIHPDRPIASPRKTRRAVYELYAEDGELGELPSVGHQRVEPTGDAGRGSAARVVVDLAASSPAGGAAAGDYLRSSTFIDHEDPAVRRLLREATRTAGREPSERAEAIRAFVGGHLAEKNLDSLLATAAEAAASRAGDCTEHSVLLTALLRADGIPARVAAGLVYVDEFAGERDFFGYHMWSQALIADRWVDLDATLPAAFDAAHITLATTALDDGEATLRELVQIAPLIGKAKIRVLEVEHEACAGGKPSL